MLSRTACRSLCLVAALSWLSLSGCYSPYRSDRGALAGGLGGAGVGALVGSASGHPGVGAAVGAGVGALSGAAIGGALDDIEARNQAQIQAQLGRLPQPGAVTTSEVVAMSQKGVAEDLIINHVRSHGVAAPLQSNDLIYLQQMGVSPRVVATMQTPVVPAGAPVMVPVAPQPMVVAGPGYYCPPPYPNAWRAYHPTTAGAPQVRRAPATFAPQPSEEPAPTGLRR